MQNIMGYSTICKKPSDNIQHSLQKKFKEMAVKIDAVAKNRNFVIIPLIKANKKRQSLRLE